MHDSFSENSRRTLREPRALRTRKELEEDCLSDDSVGGAPRHYKISNESKFHIEGPPLGEHSFLMDKVIDSRVAPNGVKEYLVKWKGQKLHLCQWLTHIDPQLVARYDAELRAGKTQSGKGAYSYKRALRREAKALEQARFEATQKLRNPQPFNATPPPPPLHFRRAPSFSHLEPPVRKLPPAPRTFDESAGSSCDSSSHFYSPRPIYFSRDNLTPPPRFFPKSNQNFEAKVFKPVRPALLKSRTLPTYCYPQAIITPVPTSPPASLYDGQEVDTIEGHFLDAQGRKCLRVRWKQISSPGQLPVQPAPSSVPLDQFPVCSYPLLVNYLVSRVEFKSAGNWQSDNGDSGSSEEKEPRLSEAGQPRQLEKHQLQSPPPFCHSIPEIKIEEAVVPEAPISQENSNNN